jgi:hypothetical protein
VTVSRNPDDSREALGSRTVKGMWRTSRRTDPELGPVQVTKTDRTMTAILLAFYLLVASVDRADVVTPCPPPITIVEPGGC